MRCSIAVKRFSKKNTIDRCFDRKRLLDVLVYFAIRRDPNINSRCPKIT